MSNAMLNDTNNQSAVREIQIRDALQEAMAEEMLRDERVFLIASSTPPSQRTDSQESVSELLWRACAQSLSS
jgi:hypothetical protein